MKEYTVTWVIEIAADSPREAAEKALEIHRNPESIATVFDVDGQVIDLSETETVEQAPVVEAGDHHPVRVNDALLRCRAHGHTWQVPGLSFLHATPLAVLELAGSLGEPVIASCGNGCGARKVYNTDATISIEYPPIGSVEQTGGE